MRKNQPHRKNARRAAALERWKNYSPKPSDTVTAEMIAGKKALAAKQIEILEAKVQKDIK